MSSRHDTRPLEDKGLWDAVHIDRAPRVEYAVVNSRDRAVASGDDNLHADVVDNDGNRVIVYQVGVLQHQAHHRELISQPSHQGVRRHDKRGRVGAPQLNKIMRVRLLPLERRVHRWEAGRRLDGAVKLQSVGPHRVEHGRALDLHQRDVVP